MIIVKRFSLPFFSILALANTFFAQASFPGNQILGKGYNIFGEYASERSLMPYSIFDFSKMSNLEQAGFTVPKLVILKNRDEKKVVDISGYSIDAYSSDFANKAKLEGNYLFFSAGVQNSFSSSQSRTSMKFYQTKMDLNIRYEVLLDTRSTDVLFKYLDEIFLSDLDKLKANELFERYGTHIVVGASLGGRLDLSMSQELKTKTSSNNVNTTLNAKLQTEIYGNYSGEYSKSSQSGYSSEEGLSSINLNVIGGETKFIDDNISSEQYKKWSASISQKPALCDFTENGLMPVWEFVQDKNKKQELKLFFEEVWVKQYPIPEPPKPVEVALVVDKVYIENACEPAYDTEGEFQLWFSSLEGILHSRVKKCSENQDCVFDPMSFNFTLPKDGSRTFVSLSITENDTGTDKEYLDKGGKINHELSNQVEQSWLEQPRSAYFYDSEILGKLYCEVRFVYHFEITEYEPQVIRKSDISDLTNEFYDIYNEIMLMKSQQINN